MPKLTEEKLQTIIDEGRLRAFSIDTNVFHRFGYNLSATALLALGQFPARGVAYLVTEIVSREVCAHMLENEEKVSADLRDALRRYAKARRDRVDDVARVSPELGLDMELASDVQSRWDAFIVATFATQLRAGDLVDASVLADMYFQLQPPFEPTEEKKAEFPDAIALLELEAFGEREQGFVLAVSRDKGWSDFAETARWVVVVGDLPEAIAMFHTADAVLAERAVLLLANPDALISDDLDTALGRFVDDLNPEIDAESFMEFNADFGSASLQAIYPVEPGDVLVIASDAESVTLTFEVVIDVEIEAEFSFYVHDSIDDDYMGMGSTSASRTIVLTVPVTMRVPRGIGEEDGALDVKVERLRPLSVEFGYVEPSGWRDEE